MRSPPGGPAPLAETQPLPASAGCRDAGGAGYVLLLESLERVVTGDVGAESFAGDVPLRRRAGWAQPVTPVRQGNDL